MTRADPARSVAVLIGTTGHDQRAPHPLPDLPAVRANVSELAGVLTGPPVDMIDPGRCVQLLDLSDPSVAGRALAEHCAAAEDVLLVYYAGHGLLDDNGELYLALPGTDSRPDWLEFTAVPFAWVRKEMRRSPARTRVLILDCCFAGRAIGSMSSADVENALADSTEVEGAFTLTATSGNTVAIAPVGQQYTAFTGELLRLLQHGPPAGDDGATGDLTLADLYRHLEVALRSRDLPRPRQRNTDRAADLVLRPGTGKPAPPAAAPAATPAPVEHTPVLDTLAKPRSVTHPLFRRHLTPYLRRCPPPLAALAATLAGVLLWWEILWDGIALPRWIPDDMVLAGFAAAVPALAVALTVPALVRDGRREPARDVRTKRWFAALVGCVCGTALIWHFWVDPAVSDATWIAVGLPLLCAVLVVVVPAMIRDLRRTATADAPAAARPPRSAAWVTVISTGAGLGLLAGGIGSLGFATAVLAGLTFWVFGYLLKTRVADCWRVYADLRRPLTLKLSRDGMAIRRPAHDRFIRWHDLDRVFVAGNVLAIAFKRDYPESAKPQELFFSVALNGFVVVNIAHLPHSRQEVLHSLGHYAGPTLHGGGDLTIDDDAIT